MIVEVMPLPETGKPRFFSNGVGRFEVVFEADPIDVKMGDPIRLLFSVEGEGNLEHLDMPRFSVLAESFRILGMEDRLEENRRWKAYLIAPSSRMWRRYQSSLFLISTPGKRSTLPADGARRGSLSIEALSRPLLLIRKRRGAVPTGLERG